MGAGEKGAAQVFGLLVEMFHLPLKLWASALCGVRVTPLTSALCGVRVTGLAASPEVQRLCSLETNTAGPRLSCHRAGACHRANEIITP